MDALVIKNEWTAALLSGFIRRMIKKKTGIDLDISIKSLRVAVDDPVRVSCSLDAEIDREELLKYLKHLQRA